MTNPKPVDWSQKPPAPPQVVDGQPTPKQLLGQELRRLHDRFAADWTAAQQTGNIGRAEALQKTTYSALTDLITKYKDRADVSHDTRWSQLRRLRDEWETFRRLELTPKELWKAGDDYYFEMQTLAHSFESY